MTHNPFWLPGLALVPALIAAGCGSSDNNSTTTAAAITKSAFIAKADAICAAGNKTANQAGEQQFGHNKPTKADLEQFASGTIVPSVEKQLSEIRALGAPAGDEAQVKAITDAAQADVDKLKKDPSLITSNSTFDDANKLAQQYGLKVCGKA
jgi:hypothetical protein